MAKIQQHVIRPYSPYRTGFIIGALCILLAAVSWYSWEQRKALQNFIKANTVFLASAESQKLEASELTSKMQNNLTLLDAAQLTAITAQQDLAIQQAENEVLVQQLTSLNNDLFSVEKKLSFYETITAKSKGLKSHSFTLSPPPADGGNYGYQLIITQGQRADKAVSGRAIIAAVIDGKNVQIGEIPFSVDHVQALKGQLVIDPAKLPTAIKITLSVEKGQKTSHTFKWKALLPSETE